MDEIKYIDDPRGGRVPLTDAYGNLTVDAMVLYNKDLLSTEGKAMIDEILANDEMARDAMEGYALMSDAKEAKVAVAAIKSSLGAEKEAVVTPIIKLDYKRFSVAAAIIVLVGISGIIAVKFIGQNQLAENKVDTQTEVSKELTPSSQIKYDAEEPIEEVDNADGLANNEGTIKKANGLSDSELNQIGQTENPEEETGSSSTKKDNSSSDISKTNRENNKEDETKNRAELLGKLANLKEQKIELTDSYDKRNETKSLETVSGNALLVEDDIASAPAQEPAAIQQEFAGADSYQSQAEQESNESSLMADESVRNKRSLKAKRMSESAYSSVADIDQIEEVTESVPVDQIVYSAGQVDQLPRFPGGDLAMFKFIEKRKIHPPNLEVQGVEGEVFVSFQLDGSGNVINVKPLRSDNSQMESDAIRVIRSMPQWQAAKKGGYPVKVKKTVLIKYMIKE